MRKFEKISFKQFKKDICDDLELYERYELPKRKTKQAAGYDLCSLVNKTLIPGESFLVPTGMKYISPADEMFLIASRSSLAHKYNIKLGNGIGIIDADYYNNEHNEGHVFVSIRNEGTSDYTIKQGDAIAQGMFVKFSVIDDEEPIENERKGGFGSTTKGE